MNASPSYAMNAPLADVTSLEYETAYAPAIKTGKRVIAMMDLTLEDNRLVEQGLHLHMVRLNPTSRGGKPIEVCGSGLDELQASRAGLYGAVAQMIHARYATGASIGVQNVAEYIKEPGVEEAFGEVLPLLQSQPDSRIATTRFTELEGNRVLPMPLALVNPGYLLDVEAGEVPSAIDDTFNYWQLRSYSTNNGTAAGPTRDEALVQAMLGAQQNMAAGRFAVCGIGLRQKRYLRRVDTATLPPQIRALWEMTQLRYGHPIHLLDISGRGSIPTYMACAEGGDAADYCLVPGAGFTSEHAATRALRSLLQAHEHAAWSRSRYNVDPLKTMARRQQELLSTNSGQYRRFAVQNLRDMLASGAFTAVPFGAERPRVPATLEGRIKQLHASFKDDGLTAWWSQYTLPEAGDSIVFMQVALTPFTANFLLLEGVPVDISAAWLDAAANED